MRNQVRTKLFGPAIPIAAVALLFALWGLNRVGKVSDNFFRDWTFFILLTYMVWEFRWLRHQRETSKSDQP
jgi:hypothetical protein